MAIAKIKTDKNNILTLKYIDKALDLMLGNDKPHKFFEDDYHIIECDCWGNPLKLTLKPEGKKAMDIFFKLMEEK